MRVCCFVIFGALKPPWLPIGKPRGYPVGSVGETKILTLQLVSDIVAWCVQSAYNVNDYIVGKVM